MGNKTSKTPEEVLAETKAVVNKSIRELDRQSRTLERRQNQIKAEMRKSAKQGKTVSLLAARFIFYDSFLEFVSHSGQGIHKM